MLTHYEVLGVDRQARTEDIRRAYHDLARQVHPDRAGGVSTSGRAMSEVNEAWRVLGDPVRRSTYDTSLSAPAGPRSERPRRHPVDEDLDRPYESAPVEPGDVAITVVRGLPWIAVTLVLVAIFVFTAFAGGGGGRDAAAIDLVGDCVQVRTGLRPTEVPCSGPNDGRVTLVVTERAGCPRDTDARPVAGEGRWLCLRPTG